MESIYPKLALCGSKNECAMTDTVFPHLSEVSEGTVSLSVQGFYFDGNFNIKFKVLILLRSIFIEVVAFGGSY